MSVNRVVLSGNLTRQPEVRESASGLSILSFGIAVNERVKNGQTGNWDDYANFFDCVIFGKRAESLSRILEKGMKVCVAGRLRYSSWEKDGQKRSKVEVIVDDVDIMQRKGDGSGGSYGGNSGNYSNGGGSTRQNGSQGFSGASQSNDGDVYDDDIPF